ncbi:MAG: hypothetical protein RXR08_10765, partial [Sulfolobaceae archaeon]
SVLVPASFKKILQKPIISPKSQYLKSISVLLSETRSINILLKVPSYSSYPSCMDITTLSLGARVYNHKLL